MTLGELEHLLSLRRPFRASVRPQDMPYVWTLANEHWMLVEPRGADLDFEPWQDDE